MVKSWLKTASGLKVQQLDIQQQALKLTANRFVFALNKFGITRIGLGIGWCSWLYKHVIFIQFAQQAYNGSLFSCIECGILPAFPFTFLLHFF